MASCSAIVCLFLCLQTSRALSPALFSGLVLDWRVGLEEGGGTGRFITGLLTYVSHKTHTGVLEECVCVRGLSCVSVC